MIAGLPLGFAQPLVLLGLVVAVVFASQMPFLESVFVGEVAGRMVADARI